MKQLREQNTEKIENDKKKVQETSYELNNTKTEILVSYEYCNIISLVLLFDAEFLWEFHLL